MPPEYAKTFKSKIATLEALLATLKMAHSIEEKIKVIDREQEVQKFTHGHDVFKNLNLSQKFIIKSLLAMGQGELLFKSNFSIPNFSEKIKQLTNALLEVEQFYASMGGLIGYYITVLKLIEARQKFLESNEKRVDFQMPVGIDITADTAEVRQAVRWGIEAIGKMAELYPVGGSGDRLNLHDEQSGTALPVAELNFSGRSLMEGLIRDLQGREYLHYKMHGKQVTTPIAMMNSEEKNNRQHIIALCEKNHWFGRGKDHFKLFTQPLVPVVDARGNLVLQEPLKLMLKPSGHGVIWKLALEKGILDWFLDYHSQYVLVRQINNPLAGTDFGILAFLGYGSHHKKTFGFASCYRLLNAAEGMNVLIEEKNAQGVDYRLTNIEYTEFEQHGIKDEPEAPGSPYSKFPSNTNILFANIREMKPIAQNSPIPGLLINMKTTVPLTTSDGKTEQIAVGRLESTMQNIADYIVDHKAQPLNEVHPKDLSSFITFNERRKTLSVTKKTHHPGDALLETPEGCFYERLQNHFDLLSKFCHVTVPQLGNEKEYQAQGPAFIFSYHPALGPLYSVIAQKFQKGSLKFGSELHLEIAELSIENLEVDGCMQILADAIVGKTDKSGRIIYGENTGKCLLKNVTVKNKGIDRTANNQYWSDRITRHESFRILLQGQAEFVAENVTFEGGQDVVVPDGTKMTAVMEKGKVVFKEDQISAPTWYWNYSFDDENRVVLQHSSNMKDGRNGPYGQE
jgi:hypothetical protein